MQEVKVKFIRNTFTVLMVGLVLTMTLLPGQLAKSLDASFPNPAVVVPDILTVTGTAGDDTFILNSSSIQVNGGPLINYMGFDEIVIDGVDGNDTLTIDVTSGLIGPLTTFNGGTANDELIISGNPPVAVDGVTYTPGPANDSGQLIYSGASGMTVNFTGLEPVVDLVPAPFAAIIATESTNYIEYTVGSMATRGKVQIDAFESYEFENKTNLIINSLGSPDMITCNNPNVPTGLTSFTVNGGTPIYFNDPGDIMNYYSSKPFLSNLTMPLDGSGTITQTGMPPVTFTSIEFAPPSEVWVDDDWAGTNPGSPAGGHTFGYDAFAIIQDGINAVVTPGTVHVASGKYDENIIWGKDLALLGTACIIDGGLAGPCIAAGTLSAISLLDGFLITSGSSMYGGGMYNLNASPNISNCSFVENFGMFGGGMCNELSFPTINSCTFQRNMALIGGGMANMGSLPTLTNCVFSGSNGAIAGGGMVNIMSNPILINCDFIENGVDIDLLDMIAMFGMFGFPMFGPSDTFTPTFDQWLNSTEMAGLTGDSLVAAIAGAMLEPEPASSILPGLSGTPSIGSIGFGGGMLNLMASPDLDGCNFINNRAGQPPELTMIGQLIAPPATISGTVSIGLGGGMLTLMGSPTLTGCNFEGNYASTAAGGMLNIMAVAELDLCNFEGNYTGLAGGAMLNLISRLDVEDSNFEGNHALMERPEAVALLDLGLYFIMMMMGGGGDYAGYLPSTYPELSLESGLAAIVEQGIVPEPSQMPMPVFNGTPVFGNIGIGGGVLDLMAESQFNGCVFENNYAGGSNSLSMVGNEMIISGTMSIGIGGGMVTLAGTPVLFNCHFINNKAAIAGGLLTALNAAGLDWCSFENNMADFAGGGMMGAYSAYSVNDSIFSGNEAIGGGGGVFDVGMPLSIYISGTAGMFFSGTLTSNGALTNCTLWGNSAYGGGGIEVLGGTPTVTNCIFWGGAGTPVSSSISMPVVTYCDVEGGYPGTGNIDLDPVFENPGAWDFHLQNPSPCINTGNDAAAMAAGLTADYEGNSRFLGKVDMGAYERSVVIGNSADSSGSGKDEFTPDDTVYASGNWFTPGSPVDIYILPDRAWSDGDPVTGIPVASPIANGSGSFLVQVWAPPLEEGEYDLVFDSNRNQTYDKLVDAVDDPNHPGFIVAQQQIYGGGPTVGGHVMLVNKAALLMQFVRLPVGLMLGFAL